jgi:hypothetical protein
MRKSFGLAGWALAAALLVAGPGTAAPTEQWADLYDGGALHVDDGFVALAAADGHFVIGGESFDGVDGSDMLIRKLNRETKTAIWSERYPAFDGNDMALTDMVWDGFGNVLVGGYVRGCLG